MQIMKKLQIIFILALLSVATCYAESAKSVNWQSDYAAALKTAATAKKNVLILFTGSDWCPACQELEQQVLSNSAFREFANENLITVLVDFPKTRKLPEAQMQINETLRKKFEVEGFPTILMLDSNGNLLEEFGYSGQTPEAFITELNRSRMMVPRRFPVPPLKGRRASQEVIKFYDSITFPPKGKASDSWKYLRKVFDFYKLQLVTTPMMSGIIDQDTANWITAMLTSYFWQYGCLTRSELEKSGREIYLKQKAAASPYFLTCYLWTIPEQDVQIRRTVMRAVQEKLLTDKKLPIVLRMVYNYSTGREVFNLVERAIGNGEFDQAPPQFIYRMLTEYDKDAISLPQVLSLLEKSKIDPWVAKMIAGKIETNTAWQARGGGYANTVTEEGWQSFGEHCKLAGKYLEDAWKMHPEWPESAGLLVYIACGLNGDEMMQWFNRAVSAQIDYTPAYKYMLWGLRPRWHGNWHMMLAFGQKAADMDESWYYTLAPLAFIWAVQDIAGEMDFAQRRLFLREQLTNVRSVLEKKMKVDRLNNNWSNYRHMNAVLAKYLLLCSDYAGAKTALANSEPNDNGNNSLEDNNFLEDSRQEMELEIALATGTSAEIFRQIDTAIEAGETEKAARFYLSLRQQAASEPLMRSFLEKRVVRLFISDNNAGSTEDMGIFALARYGSIPGVRVFLDAKYDVNARGKDNCTLLHRSLFMDCDLKDHPEEYADSKIAMLKFLMSRGADIHALAGPKWTAQHLAVSSKLPVQVLEFIAQHPGIDLNAGDVDMETPLIWCAMLDLPEHAKFLIKHGADINRRDKSGKTALDHAHSDTMRQLLLDAAKPH